MADSHSLSKYVGSDYSIEINKKLRDGIVTPEAKEIKNLMKPMEEPFTVFRGISTNGGSFLNDEGKESQNRRYYKFKIFLLYYTIIFLCYGYSNIL